MAGAAVSFAPLTPFAPLPPLAGHVITSRPGSQAFAPLPPLAGHVITSRPGSQAFAPLQAPLAFAPLAPPPMPAPARNDTTSAGDDWVQVVLTDGPNDQHARVEFIAYGVDMYPGSLVPRSGTLHMLTTTSGACVYRWRC